MQQFNESFVTKMQGLLKEQTPKFLEALNNPIKKAMTVNFGRLNRNNFNSLVDFDISPIPQVSNGFYINDEIKIGKHPLSHLGVIYSQEPSAMYPIQMLDIKEGEIILDLCASPGGKFIQILEKLNGTGLLVSNEIVYNRAKVLYENLNRMGFKNFAITCNSPADFEKTNLKFDKILVDAPCSGEGMFRRKNFDFQAYNNSSIETNSKRQLSILNSIKNLLKPNGKLVYSTCTYDIQENENVIVNFLKNNPNFKLIDYPRLNDVTSEGIKIEGFDTQFCKRRYPHLFEGEGQFMALLEKTDKQETETEKNDNFSASGYCNLFKKDIEVLRKEFENYANIQGLKLVKKNDNIFILPDTLLDFENLNLLSIGTLLGSIIKGTFKPAHNSFHTYPEIFKNNIELNDLQLDEYLKGLEIDIDSPLNGICAVSYKGIPLGGGKLINGRLKNYYPKELRN
ncbi:MAG: hypothetical protein ACI4PF_03170 [Christensenellales bacterium]